MLLLIDMIEEKITIQPSEAGQRLDIFSVSKMPSLSRSSIQRAIKDGQILVNGEQQKPKYSIRVGDVVSFDISSKTSSKTEVPSSQIVMPSIPILYEDEEVVVIDKPAGISVHPGRGHENVTIASWFLKRYPGAAAIGGDPTRPGVVHRLDKDTSGVLILAKQESSYQHLKKLFKRRFVNKEYLALVFGVPGESEGRIKQPLSRSKHNPLRRTIDTAGKEAITEWRREQSFKKRYSLLRVFPLTGRTHQIRAHLHWLGFPIVGDSLYTFKRQRPPQAVRQLLHAAKISITLPAGQRKIFHSPLPDDFKNVLAMITDK